MPIEEFTGELDAPLVTEFTGETDQEKEARAKRSGFLPTIARTGGQMLHGAGTALEDVVGENVVSRKLSETGKGIAEKYPAGINSLADIAESPWLTVKEAVGQMVPQIGVGMLGRIAGGAAGGALAGPPGAIVGGIAGGLAPILAQEYAGIRDEQKEPGGTENKLRALTYALGATGLEMLGPEGRIINKGLKAPARVAGESLAKAVAKRAAKDVAIEGVTEGLQTGVEKVGAYKDPLAPANLEEAAVASIMGGIGGGVVGGAHRALQGQEPAPKLNPQEELLHKVSEAVITKARADELISQPPIKEPQNDQQKPNPAADQDAAEEEVTQNVPNIGTIVPNIGTPAPTTSVKPPVSAPAETITPKTVGGIPVSALSAEELDGIKRNPDANANTRRAAGEALRDLEQNPEARSGIPLAESPATAKGMTRYYHGGNPESVTGPLWFTSSLQDAQGWASRDPSMKIWYVDVPTDSPLRGGDKEFGVEPPSRIEFPAAIASQRKIANPDTSQVSAIAPINGQNAPENAGIVAQESAAPPSQEPDVQKSTVSTIPEQPAKVGVDHIAGAGKEVEVDKDSTKVDNTGAGVDKVDVSKTTEDLKQGAEVERFQGRYGKGMSERNARAMLPNLAKKKPNLAWAVEKTTVAEFPDRFDVVGRNPVKNPAKMAGLVSETSETTAKPAEAPTAAQPAAPAQPTASTPEVAPAPDLAALRAKLEDAEKRYSRQTRMDGARGFKTGLTPEATVLRNEADAIQKQITEIERPAREAEKKRQEEERTAQINRQSEERAKRVAALPVAMRRNGWEIVKDDIAYALLDPATKEEVYRGKLSRVKEVADESPPTPTSPPAPAKITASTREEGVAAARLGQPKDANPYRKEMARLGEKADSRLVELASLWDSGYASEPAKEAAKARVAEIDAELAKLQAQYEKKSKGGKLGGMVPPAIKAGVLKSITDRMDKLDAEKAALTPPETGKQAEAGKVERERGGNNGLAEPRVIKGEEYAKFQPWVHERLQKAEAKGEKAILTLGTSRDYTIYEKGYRTSFDGDGSNKGQILGETSGNPVEIATRHGEDNIIAMTSAAKKEIDDRRAELEAKRAAEEVKEQKERAETERRIEEGRQYLEAIRQVKLPKGEKKSLTFNRTKGEPFTIEGTDYNGLFIHKTPAYELNAHSVTDTKSGLRIAQLDNLAAAKDFVRAVIHANLPREDLTKLSKAEKAQWQEVYKAHTQNGEVPKYFTEQKAEPTPPAAEPNPIAAAAEAIIAAGEALKASVAPKTANISGMAQDKDAAANKPTPAAAGEFRGAIRKAIVRVSELDDILGIGDTEADSITDSGEVDPIVVAVDASGKIRDIVDGFHRARGFIDGGISEVEAVVIRDPSYDKTDSNLTDEDQRLSDLIAAAATPNGYHGVSQEDALERIYDIANEPPAGVSSPVRPSATPPQDTAPNRSETTTTRDQLISDLKAKGFDGTIDRLNRGGITEAQARAELAGDNSHIVIPKEGPPNAADYAAELKGQGVGRQESWSRWIQRTQLQPGMDAKDWYRIYDSVTAAPPILSEKEGGISDKNTPKFARANEGVKVNPDDLSKGVLARMDVRLKALGYDSRGSDDVRTMLKTRIAPDGVITHPDWIAAYQAAIEGAQRARERIDAKAVARGASTHVDFARMRELGLTGDWREAGYITPRGSLIDLSGKKEGGQRGMRSYDHREAGGTLGMQEYMALGNIRIDANSGSIDISREPTPEQYRRISELADDRGGEIVLDLEDGLGELRGDYYLKPARSFSREYPANTKSSRVIADIKRFFSGDEPLPLPQPKFARGEESANETLPVDPANDAAGRLDNERTGASNNGRMGAGTGITAATLRAEISKAFGPKAAAMVGDILIPLETQAQIADVSELSDVVPLIREGDLISGFYHPATGKTYAILENLQPQDVPGLVLHELGIHAGFQGMLGDAKYAKLSRQLDVMRRAGNKAVIEAHRQATEQAAKPGQVQEETIAYLVTNRPDLPFVQRLIAQIKAFLFRKFGILGSKLTVDDIAALARASVLHTSEGAMNGEPQFSRTQDQTQTEAFKRWFGDSKVREVVYHSTPYDFTTFDMSDMFGAHFGTKQAALERGKATGANVRDVGVEKSPDSEMWEVWVDGELEKELATKAEANALAKTLRRRDPMAVYLSIQNPLRLGDIGVWNGMGGMLQYLVNEDHITLKESDAVWAEWQKTDAAGWNALRSLLEQKGYDGIAYINDVEDIGSTSYIAFRREQIKSAIGNTGAFDPNNPDIRFARNVQGGAWNPPNPSKLDNLIYALQDKQIDTRRVLQAIREAGKQVGDALDVYLQEELFHGRAAKETQLFIDDELKPLITEMAARKVTMAEFEEYLHARHAEEANIVIEQRNPGMKNGSGMDTVDAQAYLGTLDPAKKRAYEALAKRIDAINDATRQLLVDAELESQDTIDTWKAAYQHYVPLHREDMGGGPGIGQGFSVRGPASKMRTGSSRTVVDILGNIAIQREKAIVRAEKNVVSKALYGLAKANPNPDFWSLAKPGVKTSISVETGDPVDVIDMSYKDRDEVVMHRSLDKDGKIVERGVEFDRHNERALRMAMALKNLDANKMGEILSASAKVTRYFASVNTQYNPIFGVVNLMRDSQQAMFNLSTTPIAGKQAEVAKHILSALKGIYLDLRAERSGQHPTSAWAQLFEEFQKEGGQTGYRDMFRTSKDRAEAIEYELNPTKWMDSPLGKIFTANGTLKVPLEQADKLARGVFGWLSDYNTAMENAVRLSAYKVGKESGMTNQRAASMAKNLTVNFNRKGQIATQAGALYAFFNASVQGSARLYQTLHKEGAAWWMPSGTGGKIIAGGITLGAIQALMLAAAGFDDDEPPQFIRERSLIIPIGGKKYLTIPMPLGLHFIPNIGRLGTEYVLSGFRDPGKRVAGLLNVFADAFNPVGSAGLSLQTITPTIIDPLAALAENKDWTGKPIAREDMSQLSPTPGHTRAKDTASAFSKGVSKALNFASGGTDYKPGLFSPTPDQIDYLIGQATGGIGREASKVEQSIGSLFTGEDLPTYKIPLVGRFYGDTEQQSSQGNAYYSNLKKLNEHEAEIKGRRKAGEPLGDYFKENPEARLFQMANKVERDVSALRKQKRALIAKDASPEVIKAKDAQITARMKLLNDRVKQVSAQAQ